MANPNKTVAKARKQAGGFAKHEPSDARKAEQAEFSAFMDWCVEQSKVGVHFRSVAEAQIAFEEAKHVAAAAARAEADDLVAYLDHQIERASFPHGEKHAERIAMRDAAIRLAQYKRAVEYMLAGRPTELAAIAAHADELARHAIVNAGGA